ncbi:hypothetical protein CRG98_024950 [Punica granatum]|uniref:Uncharacterized protein n=1 Tax=Punica granatum TaxID=22663 RepID=A0A2I0JEI3_PUNGR|nr:hypothetical protein CRG98_024950 [Punica granatum]
MEMKMDMEMEMRTGNIVGGEKWKFVDLWGQVLCWSAGRVTGLAGRIEHRGELMCASALFYDMMSHCTAGTPAGFICVSYMLCNCATKKKWVGGRGGSQLRPPTLQMGSLATSKATSDLFWAVVGWRPSHHHLDLLSNLEKV